MEPRDEAHGASRGRGLRSCTCGRVASVVGSLPDPWQAERAGGGPVHGPSFCRRRRVVAARGSPPVGTAASVLPALARRKAWAWLRLRLLAPAAGRQAPTRQPSANVRAGVAPRRHAADVWRTCHGRLASRISFQMCVGCAPHRVRCAAGRYAARPCRAAACRLQPLGGPPGRGADRGRRLLSAEVARPCGCINTAPPCASRSA